MSKLTLHDRCDATACNSAAYVRVTNPADSNTLDWCGHHWKRFGQLIPDHWTLHSELARLEAEHGPNRPGVEAHA